MSSTSEIKVGDLVRVLNIDIRDYWTSDPLFGRQLCPIGRIGKVSYVAQDDDPGLYTYFVDLGETDEYGYYPNDVELVFSN